MTEWRDVSDFRDIYEVSSTGEVRRVKPVPGVIIGGALKGELDKDGYQRIRLCDAQTGRKCKRRVHQIVCEAFHGSKPSPAHEVAHWDGARSNNNAGNLRWAL